MKQGFTTVGLATVGLATVGLATLWLMAGPARAADTARPSEPASPAVEASPAETAARDRVAELERRLSSLEAQQAEPTEGPPSRSGRGGVRVAVDEVVQDAVGLWGPVEVAGTVRGTAVGLGADVLVHDGGRVEGDAVSLGGQVRVEPGGALGGHAVELGPVEGAEAALALPDAHDLGGYVRALARRAAFLLAFLAAGTLALSTWPGQVDEVALRLSDRPFWYGITGAVLTLGLSMGAWVLGLLLGHYLDAGAFRWGWATPHERWTLAAHTVFLLLWVWNIRVEIWSLEPLRRLDRSGQVRDPAAYVAATRLLARDMGLQAALVLAYVVLHSLGG